MTSTQIFGYSLSFLGISYYNYYKFQANKAAAAAKLAEQAEMDAKSAGAIPMANGKSEETPMLRHAGELPS